jgi:L-threonylcarbamoyladenylate synthase
MKVVKTRRLALDPANLLSTEAQQAIAHAAETLRSGGLVALPTETVYGLGANALDPAAVARIFEAKQRPSWDPIIVHIAGPVASNPMLAELVAEFPEPAQLLMEAFWPGPLTLLLPRSASVPDSVTAGRPLVGIRMPAHPVALELIRHAGVPVAAPSANIFGHISPTTAEHVLKDLDGRIDIVLDAGPTHHGVESTVLDPCRSPMRIYRPGAVTADEIRRIAGAVEAFAVPEPKSPESQGSLPSPGLGLRHYAPHARLVLIDAPLLELPVKLVEAAVPYAKERMGLMLPAELANTDLAMPLHAAAKFAWGHWADSAEMANTLYAGLRALDAQGCTVIFCPLPPPTGLGAAICDRLRKAAHPGADRD